jgi:hypothetical protein
MITVFLVFLFIVQIISFYLLALLYTKVTKFDDLEKKQRKLMAEMDNSIGAYLSELKDENERLIELLSEREGQTKIEKVSKSTLPAEIIPESDEIIPALLVNRPKMPVNLALKSYAASTAQSLKQNDVVEPAVEDDRTRTLNLHDAGYSDEEIAKKLGKGLTEVELILKFR